MRISVEQLNGETLALEVTPEMEMREVKQQIKNMHAWEDELSRDTTFVEVIFGDKKLGNDETVAEVGLAADSVVTALLRQNVARCSNEDGFGPDIDPETLIIVEIPDSETEIGAGAFASCSAVACVTIPSSVRHIQRGAFAACSALKHVTIPDSVMHIESFAFQGCASLRSVAIPDSVTWIGKDAFSCCRQFTLRAPARLLNPDIGVGIMVANECGCEECHYSWFKRGWVCPKHAGSSLQGCEKSASVSFLSARRCKVQQTQISSLEFGHPGPQIVLTSDPQVAEVGAACGRIPPMGAVL